ncbi:YfhO family protein [Enterococcus ureasiticus]|uniref:Copper ABC transporter permease n=1 Tax=Enterococcus ureasiticus TaxID=903984 RepID=A0A1E5GAG8_9ENTE|nr:YfhO family protein [Enterococcus ureasiticus]OEG09716.1 copper ABC transporter permease [Enterococcus ureasiticus]
MNFIKKYALGFIISFLIPVSIVAISYFRLGIYPTSDLTILTSDGFGQLVNFYSGFNNALHGEQSLLYTWSGSLGLNFISLMSYYINSIFSFLVYFFDNVHMPDAMYIIFLTKIGAMGASFWVYARNSYKLPEWANLILSTCYALLSFTIAYSIFLMWMDALIYLPLILLGIQRLMDKKKMSLLFVSYFLLFISNYYIAFMVGVFSFLYYFIRLFTDSKRYKSSILSYLLTSILAGGASMVIILPSVIDLKSNGEKVDSITSFFTKNVGPWDLIIKNMVGTYDTSKFGSGPFVYIGLLPLIFCIFYFVSKKITLKNKLLYGSLFLFLIISFYIETLNLFWQGFHSPNMFLFRFSFLFSTLVVIMAGYGMEKFEKKDFNLLVNIFLMVGGLFLAAVILSNKKRYDYITSKTLIVTFALLFVYVILFALKDSDKKGAKFIPYILLAIVCYEVSFNTHQLFLGINNEWGYISRKNYVKPYKKIDKLVEKTKMDNDGFYRLENLNPVTRTDSFNHNYSGVTMFSSIRNRHSSQYMNTLGFRSPGTNLTIAYDNNTLLMDSLLGIKYNIAKNNPQKFGFKKIQSNGEYSLYENEYSMPLGIITDKDIYKKENNSNQTTLIKHLSGINDSIYQFTDVKEVERKNMQIREEGAFTYFSEEINNEAQVITWEVNVPAQTQAYLTLDVGLMDGLGQGVAEVSVNGGRKESSSLMETGKFYNLGHYNKETKVKVTVFFRGQPVVRVVRPSVALLKTNEFQKAIKEMKKKEVAFDVKGNHAQADMKLEKEQVVFTTIPYEEGWKATLDGKSVNIKPVQDSLIAVKVPKGQHTLRLTYYPKGFKLGVLLFVGCIVLFIFYVYWNKKKLLKISSEEFK